MIYQELTDGILIRVRPAFSLVDSSLDEGRFVFTYHVEMKNQGEESAQLLFRHWKIHDAGGENSEVDGEGVVWARVPRFLLSAYLPGPEEGAVNQGQTLENRFERAKITCFRLWIHSANEGGSVNDSVAVDAKRILLRYGAPIGVLDKVAEDDRIRFARLIARTALPEREVRLRELLQEEGYIEGE